MSTDWTTNKNKQFGKDEMYLKMANTFASIGLVDIDDNNTVDKVRKTFYNLYKRHGLCDGEGSWVLFDRYVSSNEYTNNKMDDLVVLSSAINANLNNDNILYTKDNSEESINNRKIIIESEITKLSKDGLSNDIVLTGFFPHLDVVSNVEIGSISGSIPCWELGEETFYGLISYSDSCHTNDDLERCIEPVPTFKEEKFVRNTKDDTPEPNSTYEWIVTRNLDELLINSSIGSKNNIFKCSMKAESNKLEANIILKYTE